MNSIVRCFEKTRSHCAALLQENAQAIDSIKLICVSKKQPIAVIEQAIACEQYDFAENYINEAVPKIKKLNEQYPGLIWHYIGQIQSNKCKSIAEHFDWVHGLCGLSHAKQLHRLRPTDKPPLNVLIQINISAEPTKAGITQEELLPLAKAIDELPQLLFRGLMALPAPGSPASCYQQMAALMQQLKDAGFAVDTLSMGTSQDYPLAIANGANCIRLGEALLGPRSS